jgi:GMP synthase PP-ATPase subunit
MQHPPLDDPVKGINRVVYDVSRKPRATIEWQ